MIIAVVHPFLSDVRFFLRKKPEYEGRRSKEKENYAVEKKKYAVEKKKYAVEKKKYAVEKKNIRLQIVLQYIHFRIRGPMVSVQQ
jgi:hypothetical protein